MPLIEERRQNGFTLVEVMVALVLIAVGILGFLSVVGVSGRQLWVGQRDTEVSMLVRDQFERLRARGYDDLTSGERTEGNYHLSWEPDPADSSRVILIATYPRQAGGTMSDTLIAYIDRP